MRNLLALAAAGLIGFAGIGWYLGWYRFHTEPTATGRQIQIDLNTPKIKDDVSRGREKLRDFLSDDDSTSNASPNGPTPNSPVTPAGFQRPSDGNPVNNDPFPPFQAVPPSGSSPKLPSPR